MGEAEAESEAAGGLVDVTGRGEVAATGLLSGAMKKDWREVRIIDDERCCRMLFTRSRYGTGWWTSSNKTRRPSMAWW